MDAFDFDKSRELLAPEVRGYLAPTWPVFLLVPRTFRLVGRIAGPPHPDADGHYQWLDGDELLVWQGVSLRPIDRKEARQCFWEFSQLGAATAIDVVSFTERWGLLDSGEMGAYPPNAERMRSVGDW